MRTLLAAAAIFTQVTTASAECWQAIDDPDVRMELTPTFGYAVGYGSEVECENDNTVQEGNRIIADYTCAFAGAFDTFPMKLDITRDNNMIVVVVDDELPARTWRRCK